MITLKTKLLLFAVAVIIGAIFYLEDAKSIPSGDQEVIEIAKEDSSVVKKMRYPEARELSGIAGYLNTDDKEIKIADLIGKKVILLDFWTYSCINCQRTLPYITGWHEKYKDQGLEIIGIHTPEFEFEKVKDNVQKAIDKWGIEYPVVQDNDFGTWQAYGNRYWPRKYLIDIDGFVVYDHIGEGGYEETERVIQEALKERSVKLAMEEDIADDIIEVESDLVSGGRVNTPELYFGAWRNDAYAGDKRVIGTQTLEEPTDPKLNILYLVGEWNIQKEYAEAISEDAKIVLKYSSQDVFAVVASDAEETVEVNRDNQSVGKEGGVDIGVGGLNIDIGERLYRIIEDTQSAEHILEINTFNGMKFYAFTFG
jgi:thiol-disulfide isomerase/thioredoxin